MASFCHSRQRCSSCRFFFLLTQTYVFIQFIFKKISKSDVPIKQILLHQKIIAGIGNIYASEILFDSKISPLTLGKDLEISLIMKLIKSIRKILKKAIKYGGTTLKDFRRVGGEVGYFQNKLQVYGKEGQECCRRKCIGSVEKVVISGRSTFYCATCQK